MRVILIIIDQSCINEVNDVRSNDQSYQTEAHFILISHTHSQRDISFIYTRGETYL